MTSKRPPTYESAVLGVLIYEFSFSNKEDSDLKIRNTLKRKKLGAYNPARVDVLRHLKDEVHGEIAHRERSRYFTGAHGEYTDIKDFDVERLAADVAVKYPTVPREEIAPFVSMAVFVYHLL